MDKRILIYFVVLIGSFFLIHEWFAPSSAPQQKTKPIPDPDIQIIPALHPPSPLSVAEEKLYNLVKLYSDADRSHFVSYAVEQGLSYITLSWAQKLPEVLFVNFDLNAYGNVNRLQLFIKSQDPSKPVLYGVYPNDKLKIPHIPASGAYEIRLLVFSEDNQMVNVIYGQVVNNKISKLSALPSKPALVLFESENQYSPYAIFDPRAKTLTPLINLPEFAARAQVVFPENPISPTEATENYYVLQNDYQQLVFTTLNGALAEINLPFSSETNPLSVVRKIDFDRILEKKYPINDTFPQYPYFIFNEVEQKTELRQPVLGNFYPLLRRNIMGIGGRPSIRIPAHTYAFSLLSSEDPSAALEYQLKRFEKNLIEFELVQADKRITKTFSFPENSRDAPYCFDVTIKVEGNARGLTVCPGIPEVELISGSFTPTLKYEVMRNQKQVVEKIDAPKKLLSLSHIQPNWVCNGNGFFGVIANPLTTPAPGLTISPLPGTLLPSRITVIDAEYDRFSPEKYPAYEMHIPLSATSSFTRFRVYAGPFDKAILETVDKTYTDPQTGLSPNFTACQSSHGWFSFISEPFAKFLFLLMNFFHMLTHSWGISILLLTIALRIMLYPLNHWSIKSTLKMQIVAPKVAALQERYKKDPKQAQLQIMNLYRQEGVNPFSGCLPLLIQMPFLIGMFDLLKSTFALRGAPFIPGWINNLTAPDSVFSWGYPLPFFGNNFHLLPILLGVVMYLQQRYSSSSIKASSPEKMSDQQRQQRAMGNIMVIVFTVMFYNFPSGLNLYWLFSMLLGIVQQWWTTRCMTVKTVKKQ